MPAFLVRRLIMQMQTQPLKQPVLLQGAVVQKPVVPKPATPVAPIQKEGGIVLKGHWCDI